MLNYNVSKILDIRKQKMLYNIVKDYSKYKLFLPWISDSYKNSIDTTLLKNRLLKKISEENVNQTIYIKNYDFEINTSLQNKLEKYIISQDCLEEGTLVLSIGVLNLSYSSIVLSRENEIILSTVDNNNSVFKKFESIWQFKKINDLEFICEYDINLCFNNTNFSSFSNLILKNMGKKFVEAFLHHLEEEYQKKPYTSLGICEDLSEFLLKCVELNIIEDKTLNYLCKKINEDKESYVLVLDNLRRNSTLIIENPSCKKIIKNEINKLL